MRCESYYAGTQSSCAMKSSASDQGARVIAARDASERALNLGAGRLEAAEFELH